MKRFRCPACSGEVYFENTLCLTCGSPLFYNPDTAEMTGGADASACANRSPIACNWVAQPGQPYCVACERNAVVPDLSIPANVQRWQKIEQAKRRLIYALLRFGLPLSTDRGRALSFRFLAPVPGPDGAEEKVLTGHDNGVVTLSISEADDEVREATRVAMGEPYRTLLGHFRHEVGHFYWDVLVDDAGHAEVAHAVFGDPAEDYAAALERYYRIGAPADWDQSFVSAYATAHPWEDFAETWAHMLHIVDGVETAAAYGIGDAEGRSAYAQRDHASMLRQWLPVSLAMNAMSRSMGHPDFYPFRTPPSVADKLATTLDLVHGVASPA